MSTHIVRRNTTDIKPALVNKADIAPTPKPDSVGDEYKFDLSPTANDRHNIILMKWTVNKESQLPAGISIVDRESDRDADLRHQLDALRKGFDAALVAVGRKRKGRVDTGEKMIEANDVAVTQSNFFEQLMQNGFMLLGIYAQRMPPKKKFEKEKFVFVCVFGRDDGELVPFSPEPTVMMDVQALTTTTFQYLHVWSNPDGSMTWNFGGRADKAPSKMVMIDAGKLGVYSS